MRACGQDGGRKRSQSARIGTRRRGATTPLSRWSSLDAGKVRRTPTAKERMGKRPREVEPVELSRYDSDARRMEAMQEESEKTATMTFAEAVKSSAGEREREAKRRKTVEDREDDEKENAVGAVNAEGA